jgi:hypothetical protein
VRVSVDSTVFLRYLAALPALRLVAASFLFATRLACSPCAGEKFFSIV